MKFYYNSVTHRIYEHCFYDEDTNHQDSPHVELSFEEWSEKLQSHSLNVAPYYENGEIIYKNVETQPNDKDRISDLMLWFDKYDMQVKQAERASRLGEEADIHIDDKVYKSIKELDLEASEKAKEIKTLRQK